MANNRLMLCSVDDDLNVIQSVTIAKHFGEAWTFCGSNWPDRFDKLFDDAYINHYSLALIDEYMDTPILPVRYHNIGDGTQDELEPFEQRFVIEYEKLTMQINRLEWIIANIEACTCDFELRSNFEDLQEQLHVMREYRHVLMKRACTERLEYVVRSNCHEV